MKKGRFTKGGSRSFAVQSVDSQVQSRELPCGSEGKNVQLGPAGIGSRKRVASLSEDLGRLSVKESAVTNGVDDKKATSDGLWHGYCVVPSEQRFVALYCFLKLRRSKKVLVIFSSPYVVGFYLRLLKSLGNINCFGVHEQQEEEVAENVFTTFSETYRGILLCTDHVARRLDIPIDWIVQYDPPNEPKDYIHRVGRSTCGEGAKEKFLLFLIPEELEFVSYLKAEKVPIRKFIIKTRIMKNMKPLVWLIRNDCFMTKFAKDAYRSYLLAYSSHPMKNVFNVQRLDVKAVATSFCLPAPPKPKHGMNACSGTVGAEESAH